MQLCKVEFFSSKGKPYDGAIHGSYLWDGPYGHFYIALCAGKYFPQI